MHGAFVPPTHVWGRLRLQTARTNMAATTQNAASAAACPVTESIGGVAVAATSARRTESFMRTPSPRNGGVGPAASSAAASLLERCAGGATPGWRAASAASLGGGGLAVAVAAVAARWSFAADRAFHAGP